MHKIEIQIDVANQAMSVVSDGVVYYRMRSLVPTRTLMKKQTRIINYHPEVVSSRSRIHYLFERGDELYIVGVDSEQEVPTDSLMMYAWQSERARACDLRRGIVPLPELTDQSVHI